jgi:polysaccharide pyruvyl transferase WcaK-like protein
MSPVADHKRRRRPKRILLLGQFGSGNSGNDGSLDAMLGFLRQVRPDAELCCVCRGPEKVQQEFSIPAIQFGWHGFRNASLRVIDRFLLRGPHILASWVHTIQRLRRCDLLIVPGTGLLDDFTSGPWGMPYALFRWCLCARLCGTEVWFVSVGAGPIHHPMSRWLLKRAAVAAHYRSYRDASSRDFMITIGVAADRDPVYPDIVFGLPVPDTAPPESAGATGLRVGLGVMRYGGWRDDPVRGAEIFRDYLGKLTRFLIWLLERGYDVRLLIGDAADRRAVDELLKSVADSGCIVSPYRLVAGQISSLHDLMREIAMIDVVVATRYHNVVCALKLGKPTISLGYADKNDLLLADMGLGEFCQHVEGFDSELLCRQFLTLLFNRAMYEQRICEANRIYQKRLAQQDAALASRLLHYPRRAAGSSDPCSPYDASGSADRF